MHVGSGGGGSSSRKNTVVLIRLIRILFRDGGSGWAG